MEIRLLRNAETQEAVRLIWEVFSEFEAPVYSAQGVEEFRMFLQNRVEMNALRMYGAWADGQLTGVLDMRGAHIALFFVRNGIAAVWERLCSKQ